MDGIETAWAGCVMSVVVFLAAAVSDWRERRRKARKPPDRDAD